MPPRKRRHPLPGGPPGPSEEAVADLVRRTSLGDHAAFEQLYLLTRARAFGVALGVVRDPAAAEDVLQEAFAQVWSSAGRFDVDRGSAAAWIMAIVRHRAVDLVRASAASARRDLAHHHRSGVVAHDSTVDLLLARLDAQEVRLTLVVLSPPQRVVLALAYLHGYSHAEIARLLRLPLGTVKSRIRDGLARARRVVGAP